MESMAIRWFKISVLVLAFCLCLLPISFAETTACRKNYREGGAMAVVQSPDCPRWGHSLSWGYFTDPNIVDCSAAMVHTLREFFRDDHIFCDINIRLPYRGLDMVQREATVGIIAVFDGDNSSAHSEDSGVAWKLLQEDFFLHTYFLFDGIYAGRLEGKLADNGDSLVHIKILKEALLRAIDDIDLAFSKNEYRATIILMVGDQIFITRLDGSDKRIPEAAAGSYSGFLEDRSSLILKRLMSQGLCDALREAYLHEGFQLFSSCVCLFKSSMVQAGFEGRTDNIIAVSVPVPLKSTGFFGNQYRDSDGWGLHFLKKHIYEKSGEKTSSTRHNDDIADLRQAPGHGLSQ